MLLLEMHFIDLQSIICYKMDQFVNENESFVSHLLWLINILQILCLLCN